MEIEKTVKQIDSAAELKKIVEESKKYGDLVGASTG